MCWSKITSFFKRKELNFDENTLGKDEVEYLLRKEFGSECAIYISDNYYLKESKKSLGEFLSQDDTDSQKYIKEISDCDDFSFKLLGNASFGKMKGTAFGILWVNTKTEQHAVNVYIDDNLDVWVIKPQNDKVFKKPKDWKGYLIVM